MSHPTSHHHNPLPPVHQARYHKSSRALILWRWLHWLSIDVTLGAGISAAWVNRAWGGEHSWWATLALSSGALWVYSLDHWADANRVVRDIDPDALSPRRAFYVQHRATLMILTLFSTVLGGWSASHLPWSTLGLGCLFLVACGAYLFLTQRRAEQTQPPDYPKELIITCLYTLALSAWPISQALMKADQLTLLRGILVSLFIFCLACSNVCLIAAHERRLDAAEGSPSLALRLGEFTTRKIGRDALRLGTLIWALVFASPLFISVINKGLADTIIGLMMLSTLWRLYQYPEWSISHDRYRRWADLIFIYPALVFIIF